MDTIVTTTFGLGDLPDEILGEIINRLPIRKIYNKMSVSKFWKLISQNVLQSHHNRFMSRIKLYSTIVYSYENHQADDIYEITVELSFNIKGIDMNDTIFDRYYRNSACTNHIPNYPSAYYTIKIDSSPKREDRSNYANDDTSMIDSLLDGEIYEHEYDDDCSALTVICECCDNKAFLPVMVEYLGTSTCQRTDNRIYYPMFGAVCLKCLKVSSERYRGQSWIRRERNILIGLTCDEFNQKLNK